MEMLRDYYVNENEINCFIKSHIHDENDFKGEYNCKIIQIGFIGLFNEYNVFVWRTMTQYAMEVTIKIPIDVDIYFRFETKLNSNDDDVKNEALTFVKGYYDRYGQQRKAQSADDDGAKALNMLIASMNDSTNNDVFLFRGNSYTNLLGV